MFFPRLGTDLPWQQLTVCTTMTTRRCCPPAPSPSCSASMTGGRPGSRTGDFDTIRLTQLIAVVYQIGNRSGSTRFLSMKTSPTPRTTLPYCDLVRKEGLSGDQLYNIQLTTNSQKIGWISQSSALPVFQATVQALLVRKGTSMVSSVSP